MSRSDPFVKKGATAQKYDELRCAIRPVSNGSSSFTGAWTLPGSPLHILTPYPPRQAGGLWRHHRPWSPGNAAPLDNRPEILRISLITIPKTWLPGVIPPQLNKSSRNPPPRDPGHPDLFPLGALKCTAPRRGPHGLAQLQQLVAHQPWLRHLLRKHRLGGERSREVLRSSMIHGWSMIN